MYTADATTRVNVRVFLYSEPKHMLYLASAPTMTGRFFDGDSDYILGQCADRVKYTVHTVHTLHMLQ